MTGRGVYGPRHRASATTARLSRSRACIRARRWNLVIVVASLAALSVAGGGQARQIANAERGAERGVLRLGLTFAVKPNPAINTDALGFNAAQYSLAYAPLLHMRTDGSIAPGLATSWRFVKSSRGANKVFELTLRRNARFSNKKSVTAAAVVGWLRYFSKAGGGFSGLLGPNPRFQAAGRWNVRIVLTVPTPTLPRILSDGGHNWGFVAAPEAVAKPSLFARNTYGAGPYKLDPAQSVLGDHLTYVPNPYYYDKSQIKFKRVSVRYISNATSMLQALQSGQLDVAQGNPDTVSNAESSGFGVRWAVSEFALLNFAIENPSLAKALSDVRVRRAINYAIDRRTLARAFFGKYGKPVSAFITSDANPSLENYYPYNPARAKSLLAAAGYRDGFTLNILSFGFEGAIGTPLVQAAAKYLQAVGIDAKVTSAATVDFFVANWERFPVFELTASITDTPSRFGAWLDPKAYFQVFGDDQEINRLFYQGLKARDPFPTWKKLWTRVADKAYFAPLVAYPNLLYVSKSIAGVTVPTGRVGIPLATEWRPR